MDTSASHHLASRAPELLAQYGLEPERILPLPSWNTPVVRVETSRGTFALRWHKQQNRSEAQIRAELTLLQTLKGSSVCAPHPLSTLEGMLLLRADRNVYDLTGWLPGNVRRNDLKPDDAYTLGLTLAGLHTASRLLPLAHVLPRYLEPFSVKGDGNLALLEPYLTAEDLALIHIIERQATHVFAEWARQPGSIGVIHNDFILGNCLWQGSSVSVLDFADCGVGLYLYDLAPMLTNIDAPDLQSAFIEGYTSARPLSKTELKLLPLMQGMRHVRACLSSIAKAQRGDPGPPLAQHLASRMKDIHALVDSLM